MTQEEFNTSIEQFKKVQKEFLDTNDWITTCNKYKDWLEKVELAIKENGRWQEFIKVVNEDWDRLKLAS